MMRIRLGSSCCEQYSTTMLAYVTVLSVVMLQISSWFSTMRESVPFVLVLLSPCVRFPHSLPNAVVYTAYVAGYVASLLYFVIVSPLMGWMTAAQYGFVFYFCLLLLQTCILTGIFSPVHLRGNYM